MRSSGVVFCRFLVVASVLRAASLLADGTSTTNAMAAGSRTWHSVSGTSVEAEFVKVEYGDVHLRATGGQPIVIGMARLTPEDQAVAKQLAAAAAPAAAAPAPVRKLASWQKAAAEEAAKPPPPKELVDLFGEKLTNAKKKSLSAAELGGAQKIGIYFSAHWCGPCRAFTPELVKTYNELRKGGKPFEVVFVSADRDEDGMFGYMKELDMPWLAVPYKSDTRQALMKKFQVSGIPRLVIVDASGKVLSNSATGEVSVDGVAAYARW